MFLDARCLGISWRRNSRSSEPGSSMGHSGKQTIFPFSRSSDRVSGGRGASWSLEYIASMAEILSVPEAKSSVEKDKWTSPGPNGSLELTPGAGMDGLEIRRRKGMADDRVRRQITLRA